MEKKNYDITKKIKGKKSQSFSADLIVVIIIVLFGVIFLVVNKINNVNNGSNLQEVSKKVSSEASVLFSNFKSSGIVDSDNNLNLNKLENINYENLKENLGISNDFAIVLEKNGKLVMIDSVKNVTCIGSNKIVVNGKHCVN